MPFKQEVEESISSFFQYKTPKIVRIKSKRVGILNRLIQILIIGYIIGFVIIYKKGYQEFAGIASSVTTKVKGVLSTQHLKNEDFDDKYIEDKELYRRIWDISDLIVPASENGAFFVTTNMIITPNQTLGTCAEDADVMDAICEKKNKTTNVCKDKVFLLGHGVSTGKCINSSRKGIKTCEIEGWCPIEKDNNTPLKNNTPLFTNTKNFTVLIKNSVRFNEYNVWRRNIQIGNASYLKRCNYDPEQNPGCPVFLLGDIVKHSGENYDDIARDGAVIGIQIDWNCNLDLDLKYCVPKYSFKRLDDPNSKIAKGWNFRYSHYDGNSRTLFKATGIRFILLVNGSAGKFNFIPLIIKVGSGLGLLAITTLICDIVVLRFNKGGNYYRNKKYLEVQYESETNLKHTEED